MTLMGPELHGPNVIEVNGGDAVDDDGWRHRVLEMAERLGHEPGT
jgi:hypothetical protein